MASCTFFGHRDTPKKIEPILQSTLIDLIENKNVDSFYVGNQGDFDIMVRCNLKSLRIIYPYISCYVVVAYKPNKKLSNDYLEYIYPDELKNIFPKYAIIERNNWMINKSDYVVTYVENSVGGAARFKRVSEKKGLTVINLA